MRGMPADKLNQQLRNARRDGRHLVHRFGHRRIADQTRRGYGLKPCQIGLCDHANQPAILDNRQMPDAVFQHDMQDVRAQRRGGQGDRVGCHHQRDGQSRVHAVGKDLVGQVARGQNAQKAVPLDNAQA